MNKEYNNIQNDTIDIKEVDEGDPIQKQRQRIHQNMNEKIFKYSQKQKKKAKCIALKKKTIPQSQKN